MKPTTLALWVTVTAVAAGCGSDDSTGLEGSGTGGKGGSGASSGAGGSNSGGAAGGAGVGGGGAGAGGVAGSGNGGTGNTAATGGGGTSSGGGSGGGGGAQCSSGAPGTCGSDGTSWPASAQALECQMIDLLNQRRKSGWKCGNTVAPAVGELVRNKDLTDNARVHSEDMFTKGYVDVTTPDGVGPLDWSMKNYCGSYVSVEVVGGQPSASVALATMMNVESECLKLMASYAHGIGVGHYTDATGQSVHMWTLIAGTKY